MARLVYTSIFIIYKLLSKLTHSRPKKPEPEVLKPDINLNLYGPKRVLKFTPQQKEKKNVFHFATHVNPKTEIKKYSTKIGFNLTQVDKMEEGINVCEQGNKNCNEKVEAMCKGYDYLVFSNVIYEAKPFIKANCKAKILLHLTNPYDESVPETEKEGFKNLLKKAINADKVTFLVPFKVYLYHACEEGLNIQKYVNMRSSIYSPNNQNSYIQTLEETKPNLNQSIGVFNHNFQDSLVIKAFQEAEIPYEIINYDNVSPELLAKYKAVIKMPNTPAPFSLLENICNEVILYVPTREFLKELHTQYPGEIEMSGYRRYLDLPKDKYSMIYECYDSDLTPHIIYFTSWKDLTSKLERFNERNKESMLDRNREFTIYQEHENIYLWKTLLGYGTETISSLLVHDDIPYCQMKSKDERNKLRNQQRRIEIAGRKKKKPIKKNYANQYS
ncbi:hypothetical protein BCR32DRAFT_290775 [Anaeromyces robustus]|uniref:Uncharacterized protein n=1 Tax=Anaeromyces robustus TaxID=1754192 RepID=A0A1Y1XJ12_9FUNG|nr:hypothetical protein BCR32DRAFT_290775 [Anaeromyces robustus]|eukprot:ORX85354.1 hypothetical protein BCR32DRAFT_290775 [Anaeromyces robustus]